MLTEEREKKKKAGREWDTEITLGWWPLHSPFCSRGFEYACTGIGCGFQAAGSRTGAAKSAM